MSGQEDFQDVRILCFILGNLSLACEYTVTVSNRLNDLDTLTDLVELWNIFKVKIFKLQKKALKKA